MGTNYSADFIASLVIQEISGTISEQDKSYLYHTIEQSDEAYRLWEKTHAELDALSVRNNLMLLQQEDPSLSLIHFFKKKVRSRWFAVLAIVIVKSVILLAVGFLLSRHF